jgi:hypothetical protein
MARRPGIDRDLRRYLVPGERVVTAVRRHWVSQAWPIAAVAAATLLAFWLDSGADDRGSAGLADVGWLGWLVALGWLAWRLLNWRRDWFVATDKRFLLFYGFIRRKVAMMPLIKVTDMTFDRSITGRLLGYGTFVLESAGQNQALSHIPYVPDADAHYRAICAVLFGTEDERGRPGAGPDDWDAPPDPPDDPWDPYAGGPGPSAPDPYPTGPVALPWSGREPLTGQSPDPPAPPPTRPPTRQAAPEAGRSLYRSADLVRQDRLADTGEIPVVLPPPRPGRRTDH